MENEFYDYDVYQCDKCKSLIVVPIFQRPELNGSIEKYKNCNCKSFGYLYEDKLMILQIPEVKSFVERTIKFSSLSCELIESGNRTAIRKNKIFKKYQPMIENLHFIVGNWYVANILIPKLLKPVNEIEVAKTAKAKTKNVKVKSKVKKTKKSK